MDQKRYVFLKDYKTQEGTIKQGSEVTLFRGFVYLDGGMLMPSYKSLIMNIINNDKLRDEYLKEVQIIANKV